MTFAQLIADLQTLPPEDLAKPAIILCRNCKYYGHEEWGQAVAIMRTEPDHDEFPDNPAIDVP